MMTRLPGQGHSPCTRARLLDIVRDIDAHPYWASVPGKVVDKRSRVKRAARTAREVGNGRENAETGGA
jgi:hypothetical protein